MSNSLLSKDEVYAAPKVDILQTFFQDVAQIPSLYGMDVLRSPLRQIRRGTVLRKLVAGNPEKTFQHIIGRLRTLTTEFNQRAQLRQLPPLDRQALAAEIEPFLDNPRQITPPALARSLGTISRHDDEETLEYQHLGWRCLYLLATLPPELRVQSNPIFSNDVSVYFRQLYNDAKTAQSRLVEGTLRYPIVIARLYVGRGIPFLDLVQEGAIGVQIASQRYREELGFHFQHYASNWIRQRMERCIADQSRLIRVPVHMIEGLRELDRYYQQYLDQQACPPSDLQLFVQQGWLEAQELPLIEQERIERRLKRLQIKRDEYVLLLEYSHEPEAVIKPALKQKLLSFEQKAADLTKRLGRKPEAMEVFLALGWFTPYEVALLEKPHLLADEKMLHGTLTKLHKAQKQLRRYRIATARHLCPEMTTLHFPLSPRGQFLADVIPNSNQDVEYAGDLAALKIQLHKALAGLSDRERQVLELRFGLLDGEERTLDEIGKLLGVTRERIRQIETRALGKMRSPVTSYTLNGYLENDNAKLASLFDQLLMRLRRALDLEQQMHYDDGLAVAAERERIEALINQYVVRGRGRIIDTRRQSNRIVLFKQVLEEAGQPLHYSVIHERALACVPEVLAFTKKQSYATLFYRPEIFRPMGEAVFGLVEWVGFTNGQSLLPHCPKPLLRGDDPRSFFESLIFGRDLLCKQPSITAEQFFVEQCAFLGRDQAVFQDAQPAFDAWYASGLLEHIHYANDRVKPLALVMSVELRLPEARAYCLNQLCKHIVRMPELLLTIDSISPATTSAIQKALFGGEQAGFDVPNRLLLFQAFEAVRRDRDEWRLAPLGCAALATNPPQELPDFGEMQAEEPEVGDTLAWDEELALLDF